MSDTLYLALLFVLLALLLVGVMEVRRRFGWAWGGLAGVGALVLLGAAASVSMCGCGVTPDVKARASTSSAVSHVVTLEEQRFDAVGHYVPLDSLSEVDSSAAHLALTGLTDSSFHLAGVYVYDSTVVCRIAMVRSRHPDLTVHCPRP